MSGSAAWALVVANRRRSWRRGSSITAPSSVATPSPRSTAGEVEVGLVLRRVEAAGADHHDPVRAQLDGRREREPPAGRAVDVPAGRLGGLLDAHRREQGRDGGGGHQVLDTEPAAHVAAVVLDRRLGQRHLRPGRLGEHRDAATAHGGRGDGARGDHTPLDVVVQGRPVDRLRQGSRQRRRPEQPAEPEPRDAQGLGRVPERDDRHLAPQRLHDVVLGRRAPACRAAGRPVPPRRGGRSRSGRRSAARPRWCRSAASGAGRARRAPGSSTSSAPTWYAERAPPASSTRATRSAPSTACSRDDVISRC